MAKLIRKTQKVFGQDGATDQFAVFGTMKKVGEGQTPTYSKDIETIQSNAAYSQGWQDAVIANYAPFMEELNAICYSLTYQMSYLLQNGVPEWDDGTTYYINSIVVGSNSLLYRCLTDNCLNVDPTTDDGTNWYNYSLYGANQDLSNLTTAGIDKLHALKGYLDSGKLLSDPQLFESVYTYNHSTFDVSKFTVSGTPTITDNGIISGFTNTGARLEASIDFTNMNTFSIEGKFYHSGVSNGGRNQFIFDLYDTTLNTNRLYLYNQSAGSANVLWNYPASDSTMAGDGNWYSYTRNAWQTFKFDYDGTNIKLYINGTLKKTSNNVDKTWLQSNFTLLIGNSNLSSNYNQNYTGEIDLKDFSITVNGIPVFSGNKTGIDTIKPADYTIVGTPSISADCIASGFSSGNYISISTGINVTNTNFEIDIPFIKTANSTVIASTTISNSGNQSFALIHANGQLMLYLGTGSSWNIASGINGTTDCQNNTQYITKLIRTSTQYILKLLNTDTGIETTEITVDSTTDLGNISTLYLGTPSFWANLAYNTIYDLNSFKIYVNGDLVYQPCLLIPYTESSTGSKIVDVAYRDRVIDVYEQYGSANYYTIDEVNQNATLPMGDIYGFIEQKTDTNLSNVTQTAINTSISWGMPDWSRAISKTVYTEYTATERGWINAEGKSADKKVGLTINSNTVAAAEATGTSDESCFACLVPVDVGDVYNTFKTGTNIQDEVTSIQFIPSKGEA